MQKQRGFTLFELVGIIVIASVIVITLLNRFYYYQEIAEKTVMEMTVMNMRSGLRLRIAELKMQGRMGEASQLMQENPMTWLETLPANYMGQVTDSKPTDLLPGSWYFDTGRQELVYRAQHDTFLKITQDGGRDRETAIRFRVTAMKHTQGKDTNTTHKAEGIALIPVTGYHWF